MASAKHHVGDTLDALTTRLDPIIQARMHAALDGLDWTVILRELDRLRGLRSKTYSRGDLQAQLRMLTERLGELKFPFDDMQRTVSTLGGELRIVRNAFAHGGELTWIDAFRAADFGVRLLAHLGDAEGAAELVSRRESALPMMAEEQGISLANAAHAAEVPTASFAGETEPPPNRAEQVDADDASPDVFETGAPTGPSLTGVSTRRQVFEPWHTVLAGPPSVIDELPKKTAKMQVRAVAAEIVDYEGPIALDRLARLVAAAFDWHRLTAKRIAQISYQIRQIDGISVDPDGFVWPQGVSPDAWLEFRPQTSASDREFTQISPHEIANAARHLIRVRPGLEGPELRRAVIATFGRSRLTAVAAKHLETALRLVHEHDARPDHAGS